MPGQKQKKIVVLYSSGLDSLIMLLLAKAQNPDAEIKCLYYKHGADSEAEEISRLPDYVEVRNIDWLGDKIKPVAKKEDPFAGAIYIPGRNLIFSALAACQELPDEIWMGTLVDECNPKGTDKNEKFRSMTSEVLTYVLSPFIDEVAVKFPFVELNWTKVDAVGWALKNGLSEKDIKNTVSCWHHKGQPCGRCKQCFKRNLVFALNGMQEQYEQDPLNSDFGKSLVDAYLKEVFVNHTQNADEINVAKMITDLDDRSGFFKKDIRDIIAQYRLQ